MDLSISQGPMNNNCKLSSLKNGGIPNLTSLKFGKIDFDTLDNSTLLKWLETTSRLVNLELFMDSHLSHNILKDLPHCLSKMESLRRLRLRVLHVNDIHFVNEFATYLGNCSQLREFSFCFDFNTLDNDTLSKLGKSISNLTSLKSLDVDIYKCTYLTYAFDHSGIKSLLDGISQLTELEEISISLIGNEAQWEYIKNLVNLRKLSLEFRYSEVNENNQLLLGKILPKLNKLESVILILYPYSCWFESSLMNLFVGLGNLNDLSCLKLILGIFEFSEILAKMILKIIWSLKALSSVDLEFVARNKKEDIKEYLKNGFKLLNKRMKATFQG